MADGRHLPRRIRGANRDDHLLSPCRARGLTPREKAGAENCSGGYGHNARNSWINAARQLTIQAPIAIWTVASGDIISGARGLFGSRVTAFTAGQGDIVEIATAGAYVTAQGADHRVCPR